MIRQQFIIPNKLGLHARAAAKLVRRASEFSSKTTISRQNQTVNCKSIMGVMMLAASQGMSVEITAEGDDEAEAMAAIAALIEDYFGEGG